jgi:hypothetical protein
MVSYNLNTHTQCDNVCGFREIQWTQGAFAQLTVAYVLSLMLYLCCEAALGSTQPGLKLPGREARHSPLTDVGVKTWVSVSTPPYVSMAQRLVKHSYNFAFFAFALSKK